MAVTPILGSSYPFDLTQTIKESGYKIRIATQM